MTSKNILLGVTSGIGAKDTNNLCDMLLEFSNVKVITTKHATQFFESRDDIIYYDEDAEWYTWQKRGDRILHIELRNWADMFVIAPLSANTLAKIVNGMADNLLTTVMRAWQYHKPVFVAPSMNKHMWENPPTEHQLKILKNWGIKIIQPRCKLLAGGDYGMGAMAHVNVIADLLKVTLNKGEIYES